MKIKNINIFFGLVIIYLTLNLTIGTYFEKYEPIINQLTLGEFNDYVYGEFFLVSWFYLFPLFSFFNEFFISNNGFALVVTSINFFSIFFIISSLLRIFTLNSISIYKQLLYIGFVLLILGENLIYVQNLRTSFLCILAVTLYFYSKIDSKLVFLDYVSIFCLSLLGFFSRLEIGLLMTSILFVFCLLFEPKLRKFSFLLFLTAFSFSCFYNLNLHFNHYDQEISLKVEHVFEDRQMFDDLSNYDYSTQLKLKGIRQYIRDDQNYSLDVIAGFLNKESLYNYMCSDRIYTIFLSKINELLQLLIPYLWYIIISLALIFYTLIKSKNLLFIFKSLLMFLFLLILLFIMNLVIIIPHNFILCLIYSINIVCIINLINKNQNSISHSYFLNLSCFGFLLFTGSQFYATYKFENDRKDEAINYRNLIKELSSKGKSIVLAHGIDESNFPSRLFINCNDTHLSYYFPDFILEKFPSFFNHNSRFFGNSYYSLGSKLEFMSANENVVFLSDSNYNSFLSEYNKTLNGLEVSFLKVDVNTPCNSVCPYKVLVKHVN